MHAPLLAIEYDWPIYIISYDYLAFLSISARTSAAICTYFLHCIMNRF